MFATMIYGLSVALCALVGSMVYLVVRGLKEV